MKLSELASADSYRKALYKIVIYLQTKEYYLSEYDIYETCGIKNIHNEDYYKYYLFLYDKYGVYAGKELCTVIEKCKTGYKISNYITDKCLKLDNCQIFI